MYFNFTSTVEASVMTSSLALAPNTKIKAKIKGILNILKVVSILFKN